MISVGRFWDRDGRQGRRNVRFWPRPAPERRLGMYTDLRTPWRHSDRRHRVVGEVAYNAVLTSTVGRANMRFEFHQGIRRPI